MQIIHLTNSEIDKTRWDETIRNSFNGNLYGHSWYLDVVCPSWEALVYSDYSKIMPLTSNKKYGFNYIFRPILCQQLGLFSLSPNNEKELEEFLNAIPPKYLLIQYCLNKLNQPPENFNWILHTNYELDLSNDYQAIRSNYSENHKRNLKKAEPSGYAVSRETNTREFIELLKKDDSPGSRILSAEKNISILSRLIDNLVSRESVKIYGMKGNDGKLIAAVLFGRSLNVWYYLLPVNSDEGKNKRSLFSIIDQLIKDRSGKNEILDFEGSDITGLAQFYGGFGAKPHAYPEILRNKLPWPIKYLK